MDNETLIAKLLELAEGRESPESWRDWWDRHESKLETLLHHRAGLFPPVPAPVSRAVVGSTPHC